MDRGVEGLTLLLLLLLWISILLETGSFEVLCASRERVVNVLEVFTLAVDLSLGLQDEDIGAETLSNTISGLYSDFVTLSTVRQFISI